MTNPKNQPKFDIDFNAAVTTSAGDNRFKATAPASASFPSGPVGHFILEASATSRSRHLEDVDAEEVTFDGAENLTAEEVVGLVEQINAALDDTDPDSPEYDLCYIAGESAGETGTDDDMAQERIDKGQLVRLRMNATDGRHDLPDAVGGHYYEEGDARLAALDAARTAIANGSGDEDWSGWRVEATTNGGDTLFTVDFEDVQ